MNTDTNIRYVYFRNDKNNTGGVIAVGYYIDNEKNIIASASFCSPKDFFNKKIARNIINGRIETGKVVIIKYEGSKYIESILSHLINNTDEWDKNINIPSWFHKINFSKFSKAGCCIVRCQKTNI